MLPGVVSCTIDLSAHPLPLQQIEDALSHGIVMIVATSAHRMNQIVVLQERCPVDTGKTVPKAVDGMIVEAHGLGDGLTAMMQLELIRKA